MTANAKPKPSGQLFAESAVIPSEKNYAPRIAPQAQSEVVPNIDAQVNASKRPSVDLPLCPLTLQSTNRNFAALTQDCNFDRRKLPPCPADMPSIDPNAASDAVIPIVGAQSPRQRCTKEWTLILYMALDNDLNSFGLDDFAELFWSKSLDVHHTFDVVADIDFFETDDGTEISNQRTRGFRAAMEHSPHTNRTALHEYPRGIYFNEEPNTGDPAHFEEFVAWAVERFPARHYMLVIGGHGDGWAGVATRARDAEKRLWNLTSTPSSATSTVDSTSSNLSLGRAGNGIAADFSHEDWLTIPEIRHALNRVTRTFLDGKAIDMYVADACFMQQAEVVYELRNIANYIYGSIPIMESQGLPYDKLLEKFAAGQFTRDEKEESENAGVERLAGTLPQLMVDHYQGENDRVMASTVESAKLDENFHNALLRLGIAGKRWIQATSEPFRAQFIVLDAIAASIHYQNSVVDLKDFLQKLQVELKRRQRPDENDVALTNFIAAAETLENSLPQIMVGAAFGSDFDRWQGRTGGISIWLPDRFPAFTNFLPSVANSYLHRRSFTAGRDSRLPNEWTEFLAMLFAENLP